MTESASESDTQAGNVLFESNPSLRPTIARIVVVGVAVVAVIVGLSANTDALGQDTAETLTGVVAALGLLLVVRYLGRLYVLRSTSYVVTETELRREFALFLVRSSREIPIHQLRGIDLTQTVFQRLFGHGSLAFLTAGPDRSLGFLAFEDVPDPEARRDSIRELLRDRSTKSTESPRKRESENAPRPRS